ncbi:trigger factor [Marinagarivorans cellulosilyticus]|uniref:Trigger factor n=1 Tax=Marinagarivorans cellulosilyticus TaxID=2721545 RepID=A0AAN1WI68_9GAMM|nr:trigger factor [Marinagarivorans cellulosilyticus]BCD98076.1 trigger factor [Marinagarivorans cellulosilyticus]
MQVSVETTSGLERRLTVGIPAAQVDQEVNKRLQQASKTVRINGFRQGKVPMSVVKKRFGAGVRQEVLGDAINRSYYEAVTQEKLRPAGQPSIEPKQMDAGKDVEFVATIEVYPDVELNGVEGVAVEKLSAEITDADVEDMIDTLRKSQAKWIDAEQAAADGDQVVIDFTGTKDGEAFEGGSAENQNLVLGSGQMIEGFESGLVGVKAGEERVLSLTFPEDYQAEELRGAAVEFAVTVKAVQVQELPEVDDEFFKIFGVAEGGEEQFRKEVRENMENEKDKAAKNSLKTQVFDALVAANELEVPKALVASEINALRNQMAQQYGQLSEKLDLSTIFPDSMFEEQAKKRTHLGLLVSEVVTKESLKADKDRVKAMIEGLAATYEDPQSVVNYYFGNEQLLAGVEAAVLEEQVVEKLVESAAVTEKTVPYKELIGQQKGAVA